MAERISIFGYPGSGKSTIAKRTAKKLKFRIIEGSTHLIFPISDQIRNLPKNELDLYYKIKRGIKKNIVVNREKAREIYREIGLKYGFDFIAKTLHNIYTKNSKQPTILSGLRGYKNAEYCRLHNDIVVYLKTNKSSLLKRLNKDRNYTKKQSENELAMEEKLYHTSKIEDVADLTINTSNKTPEQIVDQIISFINKKNKECKICVNTTRNPAIKIGKTGMCSICKNYFKNFDPKHLGKEIKFMESFKNKGMKKYDVMVGFSGGKDSTATLYTIKKMGFNPLAFTFNTGYLPKTTVPRAKSISKKLGAPHKLIYIRKYLNKKDVECFNRSISLYDLPFSLETKKKFRKAYNIGRKHYSIKCKHTVSFVRSCQLCRRMVIRAYYSEAIKNGVNAIILGINEWTNLSSAQKGKTFKVSGIRELKPYKNKPAIYVFHLPFLLQRNSSQTKRILDKLGWKAPKGEDFIESNSNSCLFARSTERMAKRLLEFHPDSTRLAREVTVGFITKKQARKALKKLHPYKYTPREVIVKAGILRR